MAPTEYDEKTVKKRWKEDSANMTELAEVGLPVLKILALKDRKVVMDWIAEKGYHTGNIMNAFRLTLVVKEKARTCSIFLGIGQRETIARMKRAVEVLK